MLRTPTNHSSTRVLIKKQSGVEFCYPFKHSILNGFRKFWQFSCFYGDYISQPLEHRDQPEACPRVGGGQKLEACQR